MGGGLKDFHTEVPSATGDRRRRSRAAQTAVSHTLKGMYEGDRMRYFDIGALFGYHILAFTTLNVSRHVMEVNA
jgi:hypothetical protein